MVAVPGIDPQRVVVAVRNPGDRSEGLAAVRGFEKRGSAGIDDLFVRRVHADLAVIHRTVVVVAHDMPALALVVRAPHAATFRIWRLRRALRRLTSRGLYGTSCLRTLASGPALAAESPSGPAETGRESGFDLSVNHVRV